jgi:uncharacterized protein YecE (DUF72 family)
MQFFVGTSGYSYKEWKGSFYPEKLPQKDMLKYYGERLSTVEINNTFYRMPKASVLESWAAQVPADFSFVLKASQRITHIKRLKEVDGDTDYLLSTAGVLERRLGAVLFQLPPNFKQDLARLTAFLDLLPAQPRFAFEFRHATWFDEEVYAALRNKSCAVCLADVDDAPEPGLVSTAPFGYVRLRRANYTPAELSRWLGKLKSQNWDAAYVFFKHEDAGTGPLLAQQFRDLAGS